MTPIRPWVVDMASVAHGSMPLYFYEHQFGPTPTPSVSQLSRPTGQRRRSSHKYAVVVVSRPGKDSTWSTASPKGGNSQATWLVGVMHVTAPKLALTCSAQAHALPLSCSFQWRQQEASNPLIVLHGLSPVQSNPIPGSCLPRGVLARARKGKSSITEWC